MARLLNTWANTHIQDSIPFTDQTQHEILLAPQVTSRSFGHVIIDVALQLGLPADDNFSIATYVRWGVYYGAPNSCSLNAPSLLGDQWMVLGHEVLGTRWTVVEFAEPPQVPNKDYGHIHAEIHTQRTHVFGASMRFAWQLDSVAVGSNRIVEARGYGRVLQFLQPS